MVQHSHHHHEIGVAGVGQLLIASILLNLLFVLVEVGMGWYCCSLGLLSDACHNFGDVLCLVMALLAYKLSLMPATKRYTYGYRKSTILVSLLNAIILLAVVGAIIMEAVQKFKAPMQVNGEVVSWTAALGIVVNGVTAYMLMHTRKDDLNMRGAFLHMFADTLVSVGVLLSGVAIMLWNEVVIDSIIGLVIACTIFFSTWRLLADSLRLSMDGVPNSIDIDAVEKSIRAVDGVVGIHHIHVWAMSTTQNAFTAHIVIDRAELMEMVKKRVREQLVAHSITHATIEVEVGAPCSNSEC